ncbi:hypothetical protein SESBI_41490 [Sesbania bispinosa]|nr:hypothetical protein SESBI_41490 [Sesbania bispinosa]
MLHFCATTIVKDAGCDESIIPHHVFEFVNLDDLQSRCGKDVLTDVIGVITKVGPIEEKRTIGGSVDTLTLHLQDIRGNRVKVTIWDEYVKLFEQKLKENVSKDPQVTVAIFTSTIIKEFRGELSISTSRSTNIYVNIDIPESNELIQSFKDSSDEPIVGNFEVSKDGVCPKTVKTIAELLSMASLKSNTNDVYCCAATVNDILLKNGWNYVCCPHCKKKADRTTTNFSCQHCHKVVEYPMTRLRLELDVKDSTDSTIFVLFHEVAEQLTQLNLGDHATTFENENGDDLNLPPQLLKIIGCSQMMKNHDTSNENEILEELDE